MSFRKLGKIISWKMSEAIYKQFPNLLESAEYTVLFDPIGGCLGELIQNAIRDAIKPGVNPEMIVNDVKSIFNTNILCLTKQAELRNAMSSAINSSERLSVKRVVSCIVELFQGNTVSQCDSNDIERDIASAVKDMYEEALRSYINGGTVDKTKLISNLTEYIKDSKGEDICESKYILPRVIDEFKKTYSKVVNSLQRFLGKNNYELLDLQTIENELQKKYDNPKAVHIIVEILQALSYIIGSRAIQDEPLDELYKAVKTKDFSKIKATLDAIENKTLSKKYLERAKQTLNELVTIFRNELPKCQKPNNAMDCNSIRTKICKYTDTITKGEYI